MPDIIAPKPAPGAPIESAWGGEVHDGIEGIQRGTVNVPASGNPTSSATVTFPRAYTANPTVVASVTGTTSGVWCVTIGSITPTSVVVSTFARDGRDVTALNCSWIAIGTPA